MNGAKNDRPTVYLIRLRYVIFAFLFIVIGSAIVGPFIWQCIAHNIDTKESLEIWNGFVSIALGFVATTLSIVSLAMNFKTYDDALRVQQQAEKTLAAIEAVKEDVRFLRNRDSSWEVGRTKTDIDPSTWEPENIMIDEDQKNE